MRRRAPRNQSQCPNFQFRSEEEGFVLRFAGGWAGGSNYQQQNQADNPEPAKKVAKLVLSDCKFEDSETLEIGAKFEMSCKLAATGKAPAKASVIFRLFCSYQDAKGAKVKEDLKANWPTKLQAIEGEQVVKASGTLKKTKAGPGSEVEYYLRAEIAGVKEKCESPVSMLVVKTQAQVAYLGSGNFSADGVMVLIDSKGELFEVLANTLRAASEPGPGKQLPTLLVQGHASSSDEGGLNLSKMRARCVKSLLDKDEATFAALGLSQGSVQEFYQSLSALAELGWSAELKKGDAVALAKFQEECKTRHGRVVAETAITSASWSALHRAILGMVQDLIAEDALATPAWKIPTWSPVGDGVYSWGAAAPASNGPQGRTVDLLLYHGKNPGILEVEKGTAPTIHDNVLEDSARVTKIPMASKLVNPNRMRVPHPPADEAPWMKYALEEAHRWRGADEAVITQTINYHVEIGNGAEHKNMVGDGHPWCAAFANYCLQKAGFPFSKTHPSWSQAYISNPNFIELDDPQYGAIALVGDDNHHVVFIVAKSKNTQSVVGLGGNTNDLLQYGSYSPGRYFLPKSYSYSSPSVLIGCDAKELNQTIGIHKKAGNTPVRTL